MSTGTRPLPQPMEQALATLRSALTGRMGRHAPVAVPVGATDAAATLGERGAADPWAAVRAGARVHVTASAVLVGPWGGDGTAPACGQCLALRWQRLRSRSERDALETGGPDGPRPAGPWPLLTPYAHDAVAALCAAVLTPAPLAEAPATDPADRALPQVSRIDLRSLAVRTYPLLADPLCPDCGVRRAPGPGTAPAPGADRPAPLTPASRTKPDAGTYRLRPASALPLPAEALANPVCGALGGGTWSSVTSPTTAPVAGSVFVRGYAGLNDVTWSGQENSFATSRTLAFLEGLERYAGTHRRGRAVPVTGSYNALRADAVDPAACGFYDPRTYREDPLVDPFDPDRPIPWEWGWSLRDERPVLVPSRLVYYSAGLAADNFVFECSNGCAIGGCLEEALLGGLLELVERDAFLNAWYGAARLPRVDLSTVGGRTAAVMVERAALQGYDVHVLDNRIDLAVPVATAVAVRRDGGPGTLSFAAAASLDPRKAVEGALSEVLTYLPHLPRQTRERRGELEAMADDFSKVRHLKDHAQLYGLPRMAEHARDYLEPAAAHSFADVYRDWEDGGRPRTGDLRDDVLAVRDALVGAGHDVIAVDQTTPEQERMGLRTVSTLVPGLLPIDFGWNRQRALLLPRLRTALRRGGHRATDLTDAEIRRVPHPFP
ncbi:TOMM precursor leader peptide-binding protein [Streptomyces sp. TRM 70351]|uniref:TOMM precursor leader peptide-binding protein n=1 Tax=Streptomyces sp. TRM 70351 TaxID=3116552 RepID=UPI002E7AF821|nr:TOMM precursor leader peptide-binding protein [Streptomyces sp. TRM 70351]MEE1926723.1 TOMM precursor leader peptide-binding protein [Streptomyces sp. TRM 70351]